MIQETFYYIKPPYAMPCKTCNGSDTMRAVDTIRVTGKVIERNPNIEAGEDAQV